MKPALRPLVLGSLAAIVLLSGCTRKMREQRLLKVAGADYDAGRYQAAEREYMHCLLLQHEDPLPLERIALMYYYEGRRGRSYMWLQKAHTLDPANLEVMQRFADAAFALQQFATAKNLLDELLAKAGPTEDDLTLLAVTCRTPAEADEARARIQKLRAAHADCAAFHVGLGILALRDLKAAEREFAAAVALDPNSPGGHGGLAVVAQLEHQDERAIAEFQKAADLSPLRSDFRLKLADAEARAGHIPLARDQMKALTVAAPDDILAWNSRGKLDTALGNFDDAAADAAQVVERDPKNFDGMMLKGSVALQRGDYTAAIDDFQDSAKDFPKSALVEFQLGLAYQRNHQAILARQHWEQALRFDPNYFPPALSLAESHLDDQEPAAAVTVLTTLLKTHPRVGSAYLVLGRAEQMLKNPEAALETFQQMEGLFPREPEAYYREGMVRLELKQPAEAHRCFEHALALRPSFGPAAEMLVNSDLVNHDPAAAMKRVAAYRAEFPQSPGPWLLEARVYLSLREGDKARADLSKAIALEPKNPNAYYMLAELDGSERRVADAEKQIQALIAQAPSANAYMMLGEILATEKNFEGARTAYTHVLSFDAKSIAALDRLAELSLVQLNEPAQAQSYARQAYDIDPTNPEANLTLGWVLVMRGDLRGGQPLLEECARRLPNNFEAQYHLGLAYYYMGEKDAAVAKLRLAASLAPENAAAKQMIDQHLEVIQFDPTTAGARESESLSAQIKADPKDALATVDLAELEVRAGKPEAAAAHYETAANLMPGDAPVRMALADLYGGVLHQPEKARENAKLAHELAPDDPRIALSLGRLAARSGDYAWSLDLLSQASRAMPNDNVLANELSVAYYRVGDLSRAEDALPDPAAPLPAANRDDSARFRSMLAASQDLDAARAAADSADKILSADPHYLPALVVSALAAESRGAWSDAAGRFGAVLDQDPLFVPAARHLAVAQYHLAQYDRVIATVQANPALTGTAADGTLLYCYGLSLYRQKQADASRSQLHRALIAGLTPAQETDVRSALKDLK